MLELMDGYWEPGVAPSPLRATPKAANAMLAVNFSRICKVAVAECQNKMSGYEKKFLGDKMFARIS